MREPVTRETIRRFFAALGARARGELSVYLTGGGTAVLLGWRSSTIDLDLKFVPDSDTILQVLPELKEELRINVELASPDQFIPELPGWRERSLFIATEGPVSFFHYDPCAQALAKIERGHEQDMRDAQEMIDRGLVDPRELRRLFDAIEPRLYRYPAIDPKTFRRALEDFLQTRDRVPDTPDIFAQFAQQNIRPAASTPCPTILQRQCSQAGASAWIAHSKLSNTCLSPRIVTSNALSYSFPQTSHRPIAPPSSAPRRPQDCEQARGQVGPPLRC